MTVTGTLDLNHQNEKIGSLSDTGSVTLGCGQLTIQNIGSQTFSGVISGTGGVVKQGAGTLNLAGVKSLPARSRSTAGLCS